MKVNEQIIIYNQVYYYITVISSFLLDISLAYFAIFGFSATVPSGLGLYLLVRLYHAL